MSAQNLEGLVLAVAEQDANALSQLKDMLRTANALERSETHALVESLPLILDDPSAAATNEDLAETLLHAARLGVDAMPLRDALAAVARKRYAEYPDPAGLIKAIGVLDTKTDIRIVRQRLDVMAQVQEKAVVWHNSYGLGTIKEIDGFSDLLNIQFSTRQAFSLSQSLATLFFAPQGTLAADLFTGNGKWKPEVSAKELDQQIAESFSPRLGKAAPVTAQLLVPKRMTKRDYDDWRNARVATQQPDQPAAAKPTRTWDTARSLEELLIGLENVTELTVDDEQQKHLLMLFKFAAEKPLNKQFFASAMGTLWLLSDGPTWLQELVKALPETSLAWSTHDEAVGITKKLSAKQTAGWLNAVFTARGREWFDNVIVLLPARFLAMAEAILREYDGDLEDMQELAVDSIRRGTALCDIVVWLWKQKAKRDIAFSNPVAIFRVLNKNAKGDYLKARRDLMKLVLDEPEFQKKLMREGDEAGIAALVKTAKSHPVLNKGEQQSLLVKICRIYPQAREIVEERKRVVARRPMEKKSSYSSIQIRQAELKEIVEKKIPANSRQIALARSYGDLRENAEFKAAKEEQRLLRARRSELERDLKAVQGTDFSEVEPNEIVIPGATIVIDIDGKEELFHIVGIWDSNPERRMISFETPMGKALMGNKIGEDLTTPQGKTATVKAVQKLPADILASFQPVDA